MLIRFLSKHLFNSISTKTKLINRDLNKYYEKYSVEYNIDLTLFTLNNNSDIYRRIRPYKNYVASYLIEISIFI